MAGKLCPKIILEGTRLTEKTELAFTLNEHPRLVGARKYRYHSPLVSAEWCGFTRAPWGRGLINFEPHEEARALETYETWVRLFELLPHYSWIVDRFHLSTQLYQRQAHGKHYDFSAIEERLLHLGFHLVVCVRKPESFPAARLERLKVSGNPSQYDDLDALIADQEAMLALARASRLPRLELEVSAGDLDFRANRIADWLEQTGGLWARPEPVPVASAEREAVASALARDLELSSGQVAGVTHEEVLAAVDQTLRRS